MSAVADKRSRLRDMLRGVPKSAARLSRGPPRVSPGQPVASLLLAAGTLNPPRLGFLQGAYSASKPSLAACCKASPEHALAPLLGRLEGGSGLADTSPGHASQGGCFGAPGRLVLAREGHAQRLLQDLLKLRVAGLHIGHDAVQELVCVLCHLLPQLAIHLSRQCPSAMTRAGTACKYGTTWMALLCKAGVSLSDTHCGLCVPFCLRTALHGLNSYAGWACSPGGQPAAQPQMQTP